MEKTRTAVVGGGKMGSIHAKVLAGLEDCQLVAIVDPDQARAAELADKYDCAVMTDVSELAGQVDAVTIAAPTLCHHELAMKLLAMKIPLLIEKPLAGTVAEGKEIVELAKAHNLIVGVGHSERCNPVVQAMKRLDIEPKFIEAHRISPYPFRSMDVSVVMDVMIHDIDIILSLANSPVKSVDAIGVNVIAENAEDICNARIRFENGCMANITASRLAMKTERKVRVFSKQAYLSLDFFRKDGVIIKAAENINIVEWIREHQQNNDFDFGTVNWPDLLHIENLQIQDAEPLRVEQQAFLDAVIGRSDRPEVTAEEGLAAMKCAEAILKCVRDNPWE